jgi:hypothetical protein
VAGGTATEPSSLAPEWLTQRLIDAGRLAASGRVTALVEETPQTTLISTLRRFRVDYAGDAAGAPTHLLLKTPRTDTAVSFIDQGRREATFYADVASRIQYGVVPQCFDIGGPDGEAPCSVLIEDLSATHRVIGEWPLPPSRRDCERLLSAYARFHAAWWDHGELGTSIGRFLTDAELDQIRAQLTERWATFRAMLGERLTTACADRFTRFLDAMPRLRRRYHARRHLTIVHGDAHVWNALFPNDGAGNVTIIDWAAWQIGVATRDLAYMMALHWYPERRARLEQPLLRHYHAALVGHGVRGYDFDALLDDYRLSALSQIMIPVWQATAQLPAAVWWGHLERGMRAFEDLGCDALLE